MDEQRRVRVRPPTHLLVFAAVIAGCLPERTVDTAPPADAATEERLVVRDGLGARHATDAIPRRPRVYVSFGLDAVDPGSAPLLLRGAADTELLADLARAPLLSTTLARVVPCDVTRGEPTRMVPREPLVAGASYVVVAPAYARTAEGRLLGTAFAAELFVAAREGGATMVEAFPADGSLGIPTATTSIDLAFDDAISQLETITASTPDAALPTSAASIACAATGLRGQHCVRVVFGAALPPLAGMRLALDGLRDRFGDPVAESLSLGTGAASTTPPLAQSLPCALDESAFAFGCLLLQDTRLVVRARFAAPTRVHVRFVAAEAVAVSRHGDVVIPLGPLGPGTSGELVATATSLDGTARIEALPLRTPDDLAFVVLTEVLADPLGAEPDQEYVEVLNTTEAAGDLSGFALADAADRAGDAIPPGSWLHAGARALIVADAYDPTSPTDLGPPPGASLIRIGTSIASSGLSNGGEPLFLRDARGRRVSEAPALASGGAGRCVTRHAAPSRSADAADFTTGACSPGLP